MNKKILPVLFCGILCALGILLLLFGLSEAARVEGDDVVPTTHMLLTIPGILGILSGVLCFTRKAHRTGTRFVLLSLLYTVLSGFLIECIYFQFIYFGIHRPQPKLAIVALAASLVSSLFYMIFHIVFSCLYSRKA